MADVKYELNNTEDIISPALIYYKPTIIENIEKAIKMAGRVERLWPHVKSHKSEDMIKLQISMGIKKFKCATIPEAEIAANAGAEKVVLSYPLIGPNQKRFIQLIKAYPRVKFYAIGDDYRQLELLSEEAVKSELKISLLIDVNMGMNRTGIDLFDTLDLYRHCNALPGFRMAGLHCYDGNHNNKDFSIRNAEIKKTDSIIETIQKGIINEGMFCDILIMGGTPAFPGHACNTSWYLSPGTAFIMDQGYYNNLPELDFVPGAAILTRVVSHPTNKTFTLDLGYKGIASDPAGERGWIIGMDYAKTAFQSEEHWVFEIDDIGNHELPPIGTVLYVVPTHICPTSALYAEIIVAEEGSITAYWPVTARNRKIHI